jgi:type I restriction enzyme S subunit
MTGAWPCRRLKYLVRINARALAEDTPDDLEFRYLDIGAVGRGSLVAEPEATTFGDAPSRARRLVVAGDTIVSTVRTYLRAVWPASGDTDDLVVSTGFAVLTPGPEVDARFLGWAVQSDAVIEAVVGRSVGVSYPAINGSEIGDISIPIPSLREQRAIADYLDAETARIDGLGDRVRRLSALLDERWEATLSDRVLGGKTPNRSRPHGPNGSAFAATLSQCPDGWTPRPLKSVLVANHSGVWGGEPTGVDDTIVLRSTEISMTGTWSISDPAMRSLSVAEASAAQLKEGDIVVVTSSGSDRHIGKAVIVDADVADLHAAFSNFTQRLRVAPTADERYVWYFLHSSFGREQLKWLSSTTTGLRNLTGHTLGSVLFPGAPLRDQHRISRELDDMRRDHDAATQTLNRQIDLLQERRQALITAAVTGQLEIPGVAA